MSGYKKQKYKSVNIFNFFKYEQKIIIKKTNIIQVVIIMFFFAILYCIKNETQKHLMEIVKLCKIARRQQQ